MEIQSKNPPHRPSFEISVNGEVRTLQDPVPTVRQILDATGFVPADECVLVQVLEHGAQALGLDETVELARGEVEIFFAFRSDRVFRFTVRGQGFEWGAPKISGADLRTIAHTNEDEVVLLQREGEPDIEIVPEGQVELSADGTEHFTVRKRHIIRVFYGDKKYEVERRNYTTEELIGLFQVNVGYLLNLRTGDCDLLTLAPGQHLLLEDGMHFYSQVPSGGSS